MCLLRLNEHTGYLFFPINTLEIEMGKVVPGPGPKFLLTGTGTKNDWSRSCLTRKQHFHEVSFAFILNTYVILNVRTVLR
jgi:hypothetical protein